MLKKYCLSSLVLILLVVTACEKDDFCIDPITPKLILRFYDANNPSTVKSVQNLSIWAEGLDTISEYRSVNLDSIAIPLNATSGQTVYHFKKNDIDGNIANNSVNTLTISYSPEHVYVSRSCGFKAIFNDTEITNDQVWMQSTLPTTPFSITNETSAHVQVFH